MVLDAVAGKQNNEERKRISILEGKKRGDWVKTTGKNKLTSFSNRWCWVQKQVDSMLNHFFNSIVLE